MIAADPENVSPDDSSHASDICAVCKHMKVEHGGRLTGIAKKMPGGSQFMDKLRIERISGGLPAPQRPYACMITECMCKEFRN